MQSDKVGLCWPCPKEDGQTPFKLESKDKSQTGGGHGRLTKTKIKKLQKYYALAIRQNTLKKKSNPTDREVDIAIYTMKKNITAILNHSVKGQDPAKQHRFCPVGETSWCKWQQDQATDKHLQR